MADPKVRFKRSSVPGKIPNETQVPLGEIALNTYDGKLFASKNVGIGTTVFVVNPWNVGAGTDAYDINFTAGNVGIGSTLPTSKLSVSGDGRFTGVVTATSFSGSGSNLSGIVTYITAGSGISIDQSTGNVTITSTGGAGAGISAIGSADNYIITLTPSFNGITTAFTMQYNGNNYTPLNEQQLLVSLAGVIQEPDVAYTVSSSTLTFASAPNTTSDYFITALNTAPISRNAQSYNVTGVQTNFTLTNGYTIGYVDVYLNGARLVSGDDYTATNGTTVGLTSAAQNGDVVEVVGYKAVSLATGDLVINGNLEVTGITTLGGVVQVGVGSTALIVNGDARVTGILTVGTASVTIDGTNTQINVGSATTISTSGFKIGNSDLHSSGLSITNINATGVVTASTFSGSGASLTNLNASNLSSGVVPAARITSTSALSVGGDLYVSGNISFGGTTTQLNTTQVTFSDPDIVLGVGTTSTFNPTDNTANHGGIAIASTEGSPLVNLNIDPNEVLPTTYKKIMWFKNNAAGLGTDAWLSNYAVGIGSTQFPTGTRFASGTIQFGQSDINVVRNINSSGVVTATSATVNGGNLLVGSTSATGTSSQPLQVTGGAYVSGDIGIGLTNPSYTLDVNGDVRLGGTGNSEILLRNWGAVTDADIDSLIPGSTFGTIIEGANNGHLVMGIRDNDVSDSFSIVSGGGNYQTDTTYDTLIAYFKADGNIGLGTNSPAGQLNVRTGPVIIGAGTSTGTASQPLQVTGGGYFSGNLGIGVTNPAYKLDVIGSIQARAAATQDGVLIAGRAGGTSSYDVTITPTTLSADRTLTLADGNTTLQAGTMAITGGTLGQFAATTSSQLAGVISDETGSGALVFATSPTLTTPILGTPTSGTLTNCTGYTAANIASAGTGVTTFLVTPTSANLNTAVTDNTGSGALVFATSPTLTTPNVGAATGTSLSVTGSITAASSGNTILLGTDGAIEILRTAGGAYIDFKDAAVDDFDVRIAQSGATTLALTGAFTATSNITAYSSDRRLKENFKHIERPLEKVQKLNGYTFDWNKKSEELGFIPQHKQNDVGLIAQEVQAVLPQAAVLAPFDRVANEDREIISKSGENYLTIQYERLVPLLVEAIKEQQEQINTLKEEINNLKK